MLFKTASFLLIFMLPAAFGSSSVVLVDPFYIAYEKATDIVMGEIIEIKHSEVEIAEFKEYGKKHVKKAKLDVEKSWKGSKEKTIEFYYFLPKRVLKNMEESAKITPHVHVNGKWKYIFFLRKSEENNVAQDKFGFIFYTREKIKSIAQFKALELLSAGKPMDEAVKLLDVKELTAFQKKSEILVQRR